MDTIDNSVEEDSAVKVIVNPYNFNNKLITEDDVKKILEQNNFKNIEVFKDSYNVARWISARL